MARAVNLFEKESEASEKTMTKIENLLYIATYLAGVAMGIALVQIIARFN